MEARDAALLSDHLNASLRQLPGPAYYRVLNWTHRFLKPANYVEIGVHRGISLLQAIPGTPCIIGVDPEPTIEGAVEQSIQRRIPATRIYQLTSDDFFARHDLSELLDGPVALAFIDGLHLFEQVLRDFVNLEKHTDSRTLILLHDCLPLDEVTASRERTTDFYCGDVWKAALALRRRRPDLDMITVRTPPSGLCLVRGLDAGNEGLEQELPEIVTEYRDLDFAYYLAHGDEMPDQIPSDRKVVGEWLATASRDQA